MAKFITEFSGVCKAWNSLYIYVPSRSLFRIPHCVLQCSPVNTISRLSTNSRMLNRYYPFSLCKNSDLTIPVDIVILHSRDNYYISHNHNLEIFSSRSNMQDLYTKQRSVQFRNCWKCSCECRNSYIAFLSGVFPVCCLGCLAGTLTCYL